MNILACDFCGRIEDAVKRIPVYRDAVRIGADGKDACQGCLDRLSYLADHMEWKGQSWTESVRKCVSETFLGVKEG